MRLTRKTRRHKARGAKEKNKFKALSKRKMFGDHLIKHCFGQRNYGAASVESRTR